MHRSSGFSAEGAKIGAKVSWEDRKAVSDWLKTQPRDTWKERFEQDGYLVVEDLLDPSEVEVYKDLYSKFLRGEIDASTHRHDLGNHTAAKLPSVENICQIMWPTLFVDGLKQGPVHTRCEAIAKIIMGDDVVHDFDMLISKAPHTDTITPWHCDESYWPDMPDKRAASFWVAVDDVDADNGCMWFVPGSHKQPMRLHRPAAANCHVLTCDGSEAEGNACPLRAGSCTIHGGLTMHYTRGNTTDRHRRAFIVNFRPKDMVEFERNAGFDHGYKGLEAILAQGKTHEATKTEVAT